MKFTMSAVVVLAVCIVLLTGHGGMAAADTYAITGASQETYYYEPAADFEQLEEMTFNGVVVVSTTNPDGSPNAAVIIPSLLDDQYLIMRMAPNQTGENLRDDGRAVVTAFVPAADEEEEEEQTRSHVRQYGARLVCTALFEGEEYEEARQKWNDTVEDESYQLPADEPILRIDAVLPIG